MTTLTDTLCAPLACEELTGIPQFLAGRGLTTKVAGPALKAERTILGKPCALLYFYPAQRLLPVIERLNEIPERDRWARENVLTPLWDELFSEEFHKKPRLDQYFFAVADRETLSALSYSGLLEQLESSTSYARKHVGEPHDLPALLDNPFPVMPAEFRANAQPKLHLLRELSSDPQVVATVTHWNSRAGCAWQDRDPSEMDKARIARLYSSIMGRGFQLLWEDDGSVTMMNGCSDIPLQFASNGERVCFELSRFLGLAASYLEPGIALGIQGQLNGLDLLKQLAALDQMRNLMAATGVSLVLQTANTRTLQLAQAKFQHLVPADIR